MGSENWHVYMVETDCCKLYTGISTDIKRRFQEHVDTYEGKSKKGAKYFRGHKPKNLVYYEEHLSRSDASKRESQIKKMSAVQKRVLIKRGVHEQ